MTDREADPPGRRAADLRLLVPHPVERVTLIGVPDQVRAAYELAGVEVVDRGADLAVVAQARAVRGAAQGARSVLVLGSARRTLGAAGLTVRLHAVRNGPRGPRLVVPLDQPDAVARALLTPVSGRGRLKRLGTRLALRAAAAGLPVTPIVTLGGERAGLPPFVAAGTQLGLPSEVTWHLLAGEGDDLQRLVWVCAPPGSPDPVWVVKASRVAGHDAPFVAEARAFALLEPTAPAVRRHTPTVLGRVAVGDLHGSVETAAVGAPLHDVLPGLGAPTGALDLIRSVATWATALATATAQRSDRLDAERARLERVVLPAWRDRGVDPDVVHALPALPAVVQHGDLGLWNIVGRAGEFTVVDWESVQPAGLPLWDVAYFLADALGFLARPGADDHAKLEAMMAVLRGDGVTSGLLFDQLAVAARASGVPLDAVGPVVTLGWLHHGLSAHERAQRRLAHGDPGSSAGTGLPAALARRWLADPQLGLAWPAFTRATR